MKRFFAMDGVIMLMVTMLLMFAVVVYAQDDPFAKHSYEWKRKAVALEYAKRAMYLAEALALMKKADNPKREFHEAMDYLSNLMRRRLLEAKRMNNGKPLEWTYRGYLHNWLEQITVKDVWPGAK